MTDSHTSAGSATNYPSVSLALPRSQAKFWKKKKTK